MTATVVCSNCGADVPVHHRFCGKCGHPMHAAADAQQMPYLGQSHARGTAKLILIRGEGMDGLSYHLNRDEHIAGRKVGEILFPEDSYLSPRHANFFYDGGRLFVRDENSLNGVFVRIREPVPLRDGDVFLAGEELLQVELGEPGGQTVGPDHTHFFASPRPQRPYRIRQIFEGGRPGMCHFVQGESVTLGREGCDVDFPDDRFISGRHCRVDFSPDAITLYDLRSRNGTYVRIKGQRELQHGDYLFLGKQLLRVEITAA